MMFRTQSEFLTQIRGVVINTIKETPTLTERHLTREQTAQKLNISFPTLKSWVNNGYLNSYKLDRDWETTPLI